MNISDHRLCQFVLAIFALALGTALLMLLFSRQPQPQKQARCTCRAHGCDCTDCQCRKSGHPELRHGCCAECECGKVQGSAAGVPDLPEFMEHEGMSQFDVRVLPNRTWRGVDQAPLFDGTGGPPRPVPDVEPGVDGLPSSLRVINAEIRAVDTANHRLLIKEGNELNPIFTTDDTIIYRRDRALLFEDLSKGQQVSIKVRTALGSSTVTAVSITVLEKP